MQANIAWERISTDAITLAWAEWDDPNGFRHSFAADPIRAIRDRFGIEVEGTLQHIELPPPPRLTDRAVQGSKGAEAAYPFTCC
jgi:hypothetical protein